MISEFSPNPTSLGNGAPVIGTAVYLAWNLWTSIVSTVPRCIRMTGGWMVEPVESHLGYFV